MTTPNALQDLANSLAPYLAHTDSAAIHDDVAGEITAIAAKAAPLIDDEFILEDTSDSGDKKSATLGSMLASAGQVTNLPAKATPTTSDKIAIEDAADGAAMKEATILSLPVYHTTVAGELVATALKATPVAADTLLINDSADSDALASVTIGTIPVAQAQVAGIGIQAVADAAVALLNTTRAVVVTVTGAANVAISTSSSYAGQVLNLFALAVAGGGSYTLALDVGTLILSATSESAVVIRNAANTSWVCVGLSGATIV